MNFPGLDFAWRSGHETARRLGWIQPWSLTECRKALVEEAKILVVATTALGDSLLTLPLVETLSQRLGKGRVSLLVRAPYAELYREDPRLHRVFTVRGKYRWLTLLGDLRRDPHRIALLANITEPDLIPALWHGGVRGFLRYRSRWTQYPHWMANDRMLRRPGSADYAQGHAIENNLAMAEALGFAPTTHRLSLPRFRAVARPGAPRILIHPGASRANKRWPAEDWARLADRIARTFQLRIGFTGSAAERDLAGDIAARMETPSENFAGGWSLVELAQAQGEAVAFLSGDTGPYHLALAVGCPTVTLFAPTDRGSSMEACGPHQVDPERHRAIQTTSFTDSIATLSWERVWQDVQALLSGELPSPEVR